MTTTSLIEDRITALENLISLEKDLLLKDIQKNIYTDLEYCWKSFKKYNLGKIVDVPLRFPSENLQTYFSTSLDLLDNEIDYVSSVGFIDNFIKTYVDISNEKYLHLQDIRQEIIKVCISENVSKYCNLFRY